MFWLPTTIRAAGVTRLTTIGLISALPYLASAILMWALSRSSDLWGERRWHCAGALALAAAGLFAQAWAGDHSPVASIGGLTVSIAFLIGCTPLMWAQVGEFIAGRAAAAAFAFFNVFGGAAAFLAAYAMGFAQDHLGGTGRVSLVIAVLTLVSAVVVLGVRSAVPPDREGVAGLKRPPLDGSAIES